MEIGGKANSGFPGTLSRPKAGDEDTPSSTTTAGQASAVNAAPAFSHEVPPYQVPPSLTSGDGEDPRTAAVRGAMEHVAKENAKMPFTLDKLTVDPRSGNIMVEYSVPKVEGGPTQIKQVLLYAGFKLIWAAQPQSPTTQLYTVRGKAYDIDNRERTLAFTADVTASQAETACNANDYAAVSADLTNPWWRADLNTAPL